MYTYSSYWGAFLIRHYSNYASMHAAPVSELTCGMYLINVTNILRYERNITKLNQLIVWQDATIAHTKINNHIKTWSILHTKDIFWLFLWNRIEIDIVMIDYYQGRYGILWAQVATGDLFIISASLAFLTSWIYIFCTIYKIFDLISWPEHGLLIFL